MNATTSAAAKRTRPLRLKFSTRRRKRWLAASAITVMAVLVFIIWYRRRKRWHPADLPLVQLSQRIAKQDKSLARTDNEGQLAWLERLASAIDSRNDTDVNNAAKVSNEAKISTASTLTDSDHPDVIQEKIMQIRQDYRQLRYGRLSTIEIGDNEYQKVLKQLKDNVHELL